MSPETITTAVGFVIVIGFLWNLHRDVSALRERMAKLEGSMDILTKFLIDRERARESS